MQRIQKVINDEADGVAEELLDLLQNRYQNNLESMKGIGVVYITRYTP